MIFEEAIAHGKLVRRESWPASKTLDTMADEITVSVEDYSASDWQPVGIIAKDFYKSVQEYERHLLTEAMAASEGWIAPAARILGLRRSTLSGMLSKYGIQTARGKQFWRSKKNRLRLS